MRRILAHIPLLEVALIAVVALAALMMSSRPAPTAASGAGDCPAITYARAHPKPVTEVPRTLPCAGVAIMQGRSPRAVFLPVTSAETHAPGVMSLDQMRDRLRPDGFFAPQPGITLTGELLASITMPGTFPPDPGPDIIPGTHTQVIWDPIVDRLAWVFTSTLSYVRSEQQPQGTRGGSPPMAHD